LDSSWDDHQKHIILSVPRQGNFGKERTTARSCILGERFHDLLPRPKGGGMCRDVEVNDLPWIVPQDNKTEEDSKSNGGNRKVFQVCKGGFGLRIRCLATVDSATSYPRSQSSDWMREARLAPHCIDTDASPEAPPSPRPISRCGSNNWTFPDSRLR
jgi:hypothetical protein